MPSRVNCEPLSFTKDCTGDRPPDWLLEEPRKSELEDGNDFFGLRLLTPLRPIFSPCFESIDFLDYVLLYLAGFCKLDLLWLCLTLC